MNESSDYQGRVLKAKFEQLRGRALFSDNLLNLLEKTIECQAVARVGVDVGDLAGVESAEDESVRQGAALVRRADMPFDVEQSTHLVEELLVLLDAESGVPHDAVELVRKNLNVSELKPSEMFRACLNDHTEFFDEWSRRTPGAPKLVEFLAASALSPSLEVVSEKLAKRLPDVSIWRRGACPVCGSLPLISSLRRKEGARYMTCSFCHHEYRVLRLACPVCGETDQTKLRFFTVEDEPGFRVDVCNTCKYYIKTIDFRELDRVETPLLDDLSSLVLDHVAQRHGYKRPTSSAWRF